MKGNQRIPGKIEKHGRGLGVATQGDVEKRARELALIDGRRTPNKADREEARRQLIGVETGEELSDRDPGEPIESVTSWSDPVGSHGHKAPTFLPEDEAAVPEELVTDGVDEALHDEMVEERRSHDDT